MPEGEEIIFSAFVDNCRTYYRHYERPQNESIKDIFLSLLPQTMKEYVEHIEDSVGKDLENDPDLEDDINTNDDIVFDDDIVR